MKHINKNDIFSIIKENISDCTLAENSEELFEIINEYHDDISNMEDYLDISFTNISLNTVNIYEILDEIYNLWLELAEKYIRLNQNKFNSVCSFCLNEIDFIGTFEKIISIQNNIITIYEDLSEILERMDVDFTNNEIKNLDTQKIYFLDAINFFEILVDSYDAEDDLELFTCKCVFNEPIEINEDTDLLKIGMDYEAYKRITVKLSEYYKLVFPWTYEDMLLYNTAHKIISFINHKKDQ